MLQNKVNFEAVGKAALSNALPILKRWLPDGKLSGHEYSALNPTRQDSKRGSFSINISTGKWADFATGNKGGDLISLAAYLFKIKQLEAAKRLSAMLNIGNNYDQ